MQITKFFPGFLILVCASPALPQQKAFEWQPANYESVRLDPGNYHTGRTYHPSGDRDTMHVDIDSQQPITIFMAPEGEWNRAMQDPGFLPSMHTACLREHVVKTTFVCELPPQPMTLVVRDDRGNPTSVGLGAVLQSGTGVLSTAVGNKPMGNAVTNVVSTGITAVLSARKPAQRQFVDPNDVHIQYYRWACVTNCYPPQFQWIKQAHEEYKLTSFLKVYGGYAPDRDGEVVSIKIKAPVPMLVAMVPSSVANQLHGKPQMLEPALEKTNCQQRGVQSQTFECTFNAADGPQSLVVVPEDTDKVPHKKTEVEFYASKCVANCELPPANANANANPNP